MFSLKKEIICSETRSLQTLFKSSKILSFGTSLDGITGIGPKTIELLITRFGSVKKVLSADKKELENLIGENKTTLLFKQSHLYS